MIFPELQKLFFACCSEYLRTRGNFQRFNLKDGYHDLWSFFAMPFWNLIEGSAPRHFHYDSDPLVIQELVFTCELWPALPEFTLVAETNLGEFEFCLRARDVREQVVLVMHKSFAWWLNDADAMIDSQHMIRQLLDASISRCPQAMQPLGVDWFSVSYNANGDIFQWNLRTSSLAKSDNLIPDFRPFPASGHYCAITAIATAPSNLVTLTLQGSFAFGQREMSITADLPQSGIDMVEVELIPIVVNKPNRRRNQNGAAYTSPPMDMNSMLAGLNAMGLQVAANLLAGLPFVWDSVSGVTEKSAQTATLSASTPLCWRAIGSPAGQFNQNTLYQSDAVSVCDLELTLVAVGDNERRINLQGIFTLPAKPWPSWFQIDLGTLDNYQLSRVCFGRRFFITEGLQTIAHWIAQLPKLYEDYIPTYTGDGHVNVLYLPEERGGAYFEEFAEILERKGQS